MRSKSDPPIHSTTTFEEDDRATVPTLVTPPSSKVEDASTSRVAAAEQWVQASCVLRDNPSLLTNRVLVQALQNRPPVHVVQFMLSVNPKAASIPKEGPTPLQVAVQHSASIEVVHCLLEACPFALCATNPDHAQDPLSYVKRHRKKDRDMIELLSRPLSYWISERNRDPNASMTSFRDEPDARTAPPPPHPVDREELCNVKKLCAQVLRGHKKLAKKVAACEKKVETAHLDKAQVLKELHDQQREHFRYELIALEMKEKAMRAHVNKTEERCMRNCDIKVQGWRKGLDSWKTNTDERMNEWQLLLNHEIKSNAHFRQDLSQWMEHQTSEGTATPFVFATPLGELDEEIPLCPKESLDHVKKRPWKPLFKHWDRIMLQDEEEA
jgi:hypothetical protein